MRQKLENRHDLKRLTYRILKKMKDLQRKNKAKAIYTKRREPDCYVSLCAGHLQRLICGALATVQSTEMRTLGDRYCTQLKVFVEVLDTLSKEHRPVDKRRIPRLLRMHTKIFNKVEKERTDLQISVTEWSGAALTAVAIWSNKI
jgi:hypothetical protein